MAVAYFLQCSNASGTGIRNPNIFYGLKYCVASVYLVGCKKKYRHEIEKYDPASL